jgi:hypothetical protein
VTEEAFTFASKLTRALIATVDATIFQWAKISRYLTGGTFVVKDLGYRTSVFVLSSCFIPHAYRFTENLSRDNRATE